MMTEKQLVLASGNAGKIREIQAILPDWAIVPQSQFNISAADETGSTFVENAIIKARHAARHSGRPALADDSGLVVDALDGAPGVISARYAGHRASDGQNLDKVLQALQGVADEQRTARFICVMVYMRHADDPVPIITQGIWEGLILHQPVGDNGFGYDPIFWVPGYECASAQLAPEVKNRLSHRGQALRLLSEQLVLL